MKKYTIRYFAKNNNEAHWSDLEKKSWTINREQISAKLKTTDAKTLNAVIESTFKDLQGIVGSQIVKTKCKCCGPDESFVFCDLANLTGQHKQIQFCLGVMKPRFQKNFGIVLHKQKYNPGRYRDQLDLDGDNFFC